ncbi:aminopeptidase P family protein [Alkalicella caledoniensis]|uniref:Aminopeptidase P family protein n=1 Tax=Alkalicella caledoniensis TaxID=2731377 RepID=A0A7G9WAV8_ALKCA|nr:Xaa-Pro peptidase family protein [Alkalicella caledoniensis]QNO15820.1 aminopeptidase P family protein [Alkalicella caledoniensis]
MHKERIGKVLKAMKEQNIPQMLVSDPPSIFYLLGKWIHPGERMLVLYLNDQGEHRLFINELFPVYEDLGVVKVWFKDTDKSVELVAKHVDTGTVGIDKNWPARFLLELMAVKSDCTYVNGSPIIDGIRTMKDDTEKDLMRKSSTLNDAAMGKVVELISSEYTEKKVVQELLSIYEELGTEGPSFSPIIAYGANGADPHHGPDNSVLKEGDSIIIDIGTKYNSYCSDMTRTVFYRSVSPKAREVYNIVREANARAISVIKPGVRFCDIDAAARDYIEEKGYGKYFTHRTGHSIGIEVHDFGDVSSVNTDCVAPGMIFSIEPGIYLTGDFGVRIEDLVMVTEDGCEVLNKFTKDLIVVE